MHKPDPVETILARLMPTALSEGGQHEIETMLDELAGTPGACASARPVAWVRFRRLIVGGLAAAGVAAALVFPLATPASRKAPVAANVSHGDAPAEFVLVGESDRIESMTDEGWREDTDGSAMRAMRLSVVEENSLFDQETGITMTVSEPREEMLLMPVSTF